MIERIRIQNYKAIRDVDVELGRINVLVGPNDSGKTSFLEAVGAMCRSVDVPLTQAFVGAWNGVNLVRNQLSGAHVSVAVDLTGGPERLHYGWECKFVPWTRDARRVAEWWSRSDLVARQVLQGRDLDVTGVMHVVRGLVCDELPPGDAVAIAHHLRPSASYRLEPTMLALPVAPDSSRRFSMDPSGFGLALCLDDILGYDRVAFAAIEQRMRAVFPTFRSLRLLPEPAYRAPYDASVEVPTLQRSDGKGLHFVLDDRAESVPASQVSDGMLLVLAYLTILSTPTPPRLLLIEEPENGIHPRRLKEVLSVVRDFVREQSETQVILTRHSPYVVDLFDPSEVYACRKDPEAGVAIQRLSESPLVQDQIRHFTLGEIWVSEGEDRLVAPAARVLKLADQVAEDGPTAP